MRRFLLVAVGIAAIGVICMKTSVEAPPDPVYDELSGEVVEVVPSSEVEVVVSLRTTDGQTVWLPAGPGTYVSLGGFVLPPAELVNYVGFSAMVICHKQGQACRETRFIGLEPRPRRRRT